MSAKTYEDVLWRVSRDLLVIGTNDLPQTAALGLASIAFNYGEVGRLAVAVGFERDTVR